MEIFSIRRDPVVRDVVLCDSKIDLPIADQIMEMIFQLIFDVGIPHRAVPRFWPEISNIVGASQSRCHQMVDLEVRSPASSDSIFAEDLLLHSFGYFAHYLIVF